MLSTGMLSRHPASIASVSLGPHVTLRIYEISNDFFVPVNANVRDLVATLEQGSGVEFDEGDSLIQGYKPDNPTVFVVVMVDSGQASFRALGSLLGKFDPADYVVVFCRDDASANLVIKARSSTAVFLSDDLNDLLILIRQIRALPNLISIDLSDLFSLWSDRASVVQTVSRHGIMKSFPSVRSVDGVFLSFPKESSLLEIDGAIDELKSLLSPSVDLVWRDGGAQPLHQVDVCISRLLGDQGFEHGAEAPHPE